MRWYSGYIRQHLDRTHEAMNTHMGAAGQLTIAYKLSYPRTLTGVLVNFWSKASDML